eukprot:gnl/MRDRNA2_/MRDRNA2_83862_c0_seq3.p1 gnl/MRDRNA2_/MRDRNA2_83862_c0~~gnl/MRDRNA2_/MRDRNA2_83862_c0_seq3.p1  ORF type:complete len:116 (+),score=4.76 gnl/MRDRNA2_/MRDRNA2_83862_c0_seq3:225-572(+)
MTFYIIHSATCILHGGHCCTSDTLASHPYPIQSINTCFQNCVLDATPLACILRVALASESERHPKIKKGVQNWYFTLHCESVGSFGTHTLSSGFSLKSSGTSQNEHHTALTFDGS